MIDWPGLWNGPGIRYDRFRAVTSSVRRPCFRWAIALALIVLVRFGTRAGADSPPGDDPGGSSSAASTPEAGPEPAGLDERIRRLEALGSTVLEQNRRLAEENRRLAEENRGLARRLQEMNRRHEELSSRLDHLASPLPAPTPLTSPAATATATAVPPNPDLPAEAAAGGGAYVPAPPAEPPGEDRPAFGPIWAGSEFLIGGYDSEKSQFILAQPRDPERTPFALNFDLITQVRYTGFARSAPTWTDSAGVVLPVRNYDTVQVNRNWFQFSGYALDPRLQFMAVVFSSSTNNATLFLGWLDYRFSRAFTLSAGYYKVPGSREWYDSFRYTLGADRTMATTFFRPDMSPGIWASGEPVTGLHYVAMVANSFNGLVLTNNRVGNNMAFAGSAWWEPLGAFGPGPSDIEEHERPVVRIGSSLTLAREILAGAAAVQANPENTIFRLSDGTPLAAAGALAPGVDIYKTSAQLWAVDAAFKYRGLSLSGEYYFRWLNDFRYTGGPLPIRGLFDTGAYAQGSYFLVPKRVELYARHSFVTGPFGGGDEWSGGLNWYVLARRNWRMTFDVTRINHSPAENELTGYRAGESGTLFQLQMLTDF